MTNKRSQSRSQGSGQQASSYGQRIKAIVAEHDRQMAEIAKLREDGQARGSELGKAYALLTRFWGKADWSGREDIIRTSGWLLRVAQIASGLTVHNHK